MKFPDDALYVVFLFACMYVCVCFALRYHYALLYQGFSVYRASDIFRYLKLLRTRNACHANPEREREHLVELNTDAAPVDISTFVSLPLLLWTVLRSTSFFMFF